MHPGCSTRSLVNSFHTGYQLTSHILFHNRFFYSTNLPASTLSDPFNRKHFSVCLKSSHSISIRLGVLNLSLLTFCQKATGSFNSVHCTISLGSLCELLQNITKTLEAINDDIMGTGKGAGHATQTCIQTLLCWFTLQWKYYRIYFLTTIIVYYSI